MKDLLQRTAPSRRRRRLSLRCIAAQAAKRRRTRAPFLRASMPIQQLRVMRGIRGMLTFGRQRKPSQIVVLLHGLNDTAKDCSSGVVARWVKGLPEALFVVPQSSDRTHQELASLGDLRGVRRTLATLPGELAGVPTCAPGSVSSCQRLARR
eukprot:CAMPEP_0180462116 /NCGR_PEP_ID=MMETSP1036_2-20121128/24236_1 /TAXON_ID=632150 /ORGANISM="Azadinium spinosum, Strain 3D9" /LENGTH=151 /DNA_ID=CAMNT_0022468873 /DNA_START=260 /DNA_END=711 /DNA_ORIENTATION=+